MPSVRDVRGNDGHAALSGSKRPFELRRLERDDVSGILLGGVHGAGASED